MKNKSFVNISIALLLPALLSTCSTSPKFETEWTSSLPRLGSSSSPSCTDLNGDGVLDVVLGASRNEYQKSDSSVIALDGKTGALLWNVLAKDQVVGSPLFLDITGDHVMDVFIGGRSSEFIAINGATGKELWRYVPLRTDSVSALVRFNFFNAQRIPDQDNDGLDDLLFANGGNAHAAPNTRRNRRAGVLGVFSSKTGKLLARDTMPDGNETYMSPLIADLDGNNKSLTIIFGTGGETLGGNLFRTDLKSLMENNISGAIKLASGEKRGFIAPVTIADINSDGTKDIVANWFGGKLMAIDGRENKLLWDFQVPMTESYSTAVPGFFNGDSIPDFFTIYNKGAWPDNHGSIQVIVDGRTGKLLRSDSLGCMGYSSGITADINRDGFDDIIWSINDFACNPPSFLGGPDLSTDNHSLNLLDFHNKTIQHITAPLLSKNISSTPWIGDMDADGLLELVYCIQRNALRVDEYNGIQVVRMSTNIRTLPRWGAYLGADGTGVFSAVR